MHNDDKKQSEDPVSPKTQLRRELTTCDTERIHEIGEIQTGGYVVSVRAESPEMIRIESMSENLVWAPWMLARKEASAILGKSIFEVFEPSVTSVLASLIARFQALLDSTDTDNFTTLRMLCKGSIASVGNSQLLCCSVVGSSSASTYVLELEDVGPNQAESPRRRASLLPPPPTADDDDCSSEKLVHSQILETGEILARIHSSPTPELAAAAFCDAAMQIIPGYDRGMVYRFCEDLSGVVIYERVEPGSVVDGNSSYLNMRFPAGDIPQSARDLYLKVGLRFVIDTHSKNHKLLNWTEASGPVDLTMSCLRACAPVHVAYLKNMGVVSSLSVAIVVNGKLWGLYALHAYSKPVKPTVEQRIMLEMAATISSMRVANLDFEATQKRKLDMSSTIVHMQTAPNLNDYLRTHAKHILRLLRADLLVVYDGDGDKRQLSFGDASIAPTPEGLAELASRSKLKNTALALSSFTHGLSGLGAGVLFFAHHHDFVVVVRRSKMCDVSWGGNPDKILDPDVPGRLMPRTSFALYTEKAHKESEAWTPADLELGDMLFERIAQFLHDVILKTFKLSLDQSNSEFMEAVDMAQQQHEFFAHMSHELRTPFHGVISSLQILKSGGERLCAEEREEIVESALESGKEMLKTLDDILTIAKSKNCVETVSKPIVFAKIIEGTRHAMSPIAKNKGVELKVGQACTLVDNDVLVDWRSLVILADETRIGQITNNLVNNAIKFTESGGRVSATGTVASAESVLAMWAACRRRFDSANVPDLAPKKKPLKREGSSGSAAFSAAEQDEEEEAVVATGGDEITAEHLTYSRVWYILEVEDTGCGVSLADLRVMFDAYKQVAQAGVSTTYQGTGLGLHICRSHVGLMRGQVGVLSTLGGGTLFFCAVPIELHEAGPPSSSSSSSTPPTTPPEQRSSLSSTFSEEDEEEAIAESASSSPGSPRRGSGSCSSHFIIVDDSAINLKLTKRKIQLALGDDVKVSLCADGFEIIEFYKELILKGEADQVSCILMDYHMPKCSGLEAIVEIRRLEKQQASPVKPVYIVAFTADISESTRRDLVVAGSNDVFPKPDLGGQIERLVVERASQL